MDLDGTTPMGINSAIERVNSTIHGVSDEYVKAELQSLKENLSEMRVALVELENLEEKHGRGNVTPDTYFDRRMKLVRDFYAAKDAIPSKIIPSIAERAPLPEEKSVIMKFKGLMKNNKEFVPVIANLLLTVAKVFARV